MNLTKLISARISKELDSQIKREVRSRKLAGLRANEADIVREALIYHLKKDGQETPAEDPRQIKFA